MNDPNKRTNITHPPCGLVNSMLRSDLELAVLQESINKLSVMETPKGFYVIIYLKWSETKAWYLTTRRNRNSPRIFRDFNRLNDHLKDICPTDGFTLYRNQELPPAKSTKSQ